jgi:hypothetical protein
MNLKLIGTAPAVLIALAALGGVAGCSKEAAVKSPGAILSPLQHAVVLPQDHEARPGTITQDGSTPPSDLASISYGGGSISFWPYTGATYDGVPSDPINLIFTGHADPVQIRAALIALDGDRSAFGMPPVPPFNSRWSDAMGDVQTSYAADGGWNGSVIQLALGDYGPIRFHLRLFRTGKTFGSDGVWTLGAAHFEALIPGTTEHQVLSWELAQQMVMVDLLRSGLLKAGTPPLSGPINQAPSFREIPGLIYNQLPPELIALLAAVGAPPQPVSGNVPIASDGQATILELEKAPAVPAGSTTQSFTVEFGQAIPKPLCSDGPFDWVYATGPVQFQKTVAVDEAGRFQYSARASGRLTVTPVDITTNPPTPVGTPFAATVADVQSGFHDPVSESVQMLSKRIAPQKGGAELLMTDLKVSTPGPDRYRASTQCLQP